MAITTLSQVNNLLPGTQFGFQKANATAKSAGSFQSLWTAGGFPAAGSAPTTTTGTIPTNLTTGAVPIINASGANSLYLAKIDNTIGTTSGVLILYDLLWFNATLSGTVATAQSFTMPSLTRYTDGDDVEIWLYVWTATGSTAVTWTASYTNTASVAGRIATGLTQLVASPVVGQMFPSSLQAGDVGVKSVQSLTLSATTGTAGSLGLVLLRRIAEIPIVAPSIYNFNQQYPIFSQDVITLGKPLIQPNACLATMVFTSGAATGIFNSKFNFIEG